MAPAAPPSPLEDDDLLEEILLRLPLQHSSLPRASGVCKRWLGLITDPKFIARFRAHHRKPPFLGVFHRNSQGIAFAPILDPPDRVPTLRFDLRRYGDYWVLDCRHGRLLAVHPGQSKLLVCDPITGKQRRVAVPRVFREGASFQGSVLCTDRAQGHVHGGCRSSPFKVVLMTMYTKDHRPMARVYSSETSRWGKIISTAAPPCDLGDSGIAGALVGNALYWLQPGMDKDILVFDLDEQSLAFITGPPITSELLFGQRRIIQAGDGAVGLGILSYPRFQMWQRNVNCHGDATWVLWKTIEMHNIVGIPRTERNCILLGYCEDTDAILISLEGYVHMVQLKSMQSKRIHETQYVKCYYPFASFYTPGERKASGVLSKLVTLLHQYGWQRLYKLSERTC